MQLVKSFASFADDDFDDDERKKSKINGTPPPSPLRAASLSWLLCKIDGMIFNTRHVVVVVVLITHKRELKGTDARTLARLQMNELKQLEDFVDDG